MAMRILGMDDGKYRPFFICEDCKTEYTDGGELVAYLAKPHDFKVEVKMFRIDDYPTGKLEGYTGYQIQEMFDVLEGYGDPPWGLTEKEIFDMFWESADTDW